MLTRIISGIVMGVGVFALLFLCSWHYFALFVALIAVIGQDELQRMLSPNRNLVSRLPLGVITAILAMSPLITALNISEASKIALVGALWFISFIVIAARHLIKPLPLTQSAQRVGVDMLGVLYLGATLPAILGLRLLDVERGWAWVLLAMLITFGGDTGGYFAGRAMGGKLFGERRLAPQLSPKKTWEGYIGGILLGTGGALFARVQLEACATLSVTDCLILGGVGVTLGVAGDLFESMMKRSSGVKDSGQLIPGHGGVLDRVDALLFVSPALYIYLMIKLAA